MLRGLRDSWRLLSTRQKVEYSAFLLGRILINFLDVIGIALIAAAISVAAQNPLSSIWIPPWAKDLVETPIWLLLGAGIAFSAKSFVGAYISKRMTLYLANLEVAGTREILRSFFLGGLGQLRRLSPGKLEWAVLRSTEFTFGRMLGQGANLVSELSLAAMVFGVMLLFDWASAIGLAAYFGAILYGFQALTKTRLQRSGKDMAEASASVTENIRNMMIAFRELTITGKMLDLIRATLQQRARVAIGMATESYLNSLPRLIVEVGLIVGALSLMALQTTVGDLEESFVTLGVMLVGSLRIMSALLPLQRSFAAIKFYSPQAAQAQSILSILGEPMRTAEESTISEEPRRGKLDGGVRVSVSNLVFRHASSNGATAPSSKSRPVLRGVSLEIEAGNFVALLGESGVGKSTLVDLILGLYKPSSGEILLNGLPPADFLERYPEEVGYVPQKPGMIPGTIAQNVALGVPDHLIDHERVSSVLDSVQLGEVVKNLPEMAQSKIGNHADELSGGQLQRLGLARALYFEPRLLVLDEATNALDAETEISIVAALERFRGEKTAIVIAHSATTVKNADQAYLLRDGKLIPARLDETTQGYSA